MTETIKTETSLKYQEAKTIDEVSPPRNTSDEYPQNYRMVSTRRTEGSISFRYVPRDIPSETVSESQYE